MPPQPLCRHRQSRPQPKPAVTDFGLYSHTAVRSSSLPFNGLHIHGTAASAGVLLRTKDSLPYLWVLCSSRSVKLERWECWRQKRKLVSGPKHRGVCGSSGVFPLEKYWNCTCKIVQNCVHFIRKIVRMPFIMRFLNILKWKCRSHAFRRFFNNGNDFLTRSP